LHTTQGVTCVRICLVNPATLDNDDEVNHTAESTYDCNEHAQIQRAPNQFRGILIGVDHYGNWDEFISSLTDDQDDHGKVAQQREVRPLLKEGDEEAAFLVKEADSSEIHPVVFSIPVTTSTTESSASGAPPAIHDTDHPPGLRLPLLLMSPWIIHKSQEEEDEVPSPLMWSI
jgi:hypothetical protein